MSGERIAGEEGSGPSLDTLLFKCQIEEENLINETEKEQPIKKKEN